MNIKSKKFLTVILTLIFAVTVFTLTAFAESNTSAQGDPPTQEPANSVSVGEGTSAQPGSSSRIEESSQAGESSQSGESQSGESSQVEASSGKSSSEKPRTSSSSKQPVVNNNVNTHKNEVEARASQAAQTISDPDVLSSQDWGELLSSGESAASETVAAAGTVSSQTGSTPGIGGVSWLLVLGVVLIVLAFCGIGLFIYLQFFFKGRPGGGSKFAPAAGPAEADEPMTFEDISSDSSGIQHRGDSVSDDTQTFTDIHSSSATAVKAPSAVKAKPAVKAPSVLRPQPALKPMTSDKDVTAPIPQQILNRNGADSSSSDRTALPRSQAQPVKESNFDWEKFFNEEK
ncbi:hypothetical protein [Caproiciproducens sp.]|uniref:hypothetical protein n=1 Tax=Caproiciproducens sp. TaxID=1954376 RepID=UPI002896C2D9|nr:hypothetical protein [Caproiciproducens sp.]